MNLLIVIPARGGSKGIPNKNIKLLGGKPLIQYSIEVARELFHDSNICVSTDSPEIRDTVEKLGLHVPSLRPPHLATDSASTYDVLIHALNEFEKTHKTPDFIVLLQPTSPFRRAFHLKEAIALYDKDIDMVVSVKETSSNPYYVLFEEDENGWLHKSKTGTFSRRQDCPKVWEYNGAVYVINPKSLRHQSHLEFTRVRKYVMGEEYSIDLDTPRDWQIAECLLGSSESPLVT